MDALADVGYRSAEEIAPKNHRAAPIFFIEVMRALKMAAPEEERVLLSIQSRSGGAANPVAKLVSDDGAGHDGQQKPPQRNHSSGGKDAGSDQQGIARQKEPNEKAGFDEDDETDQGRSAPAD